MLLLHSTIFYFHIKILLSRETVFPPLKEEWTPLGVRCMTSCCISSKSLTITMTELRQDRLEDQARARDTLTGWWTCPGEAGLSTTTNTSFMPAISVISCLSFQTTLQKTLFSQSLSRRPQHHSLLLSSHGQVRGQEPGPGLRLQQLRVRVQPRIKIRLSVLKLQMWRHSHE